MAEASTAISAGAAVEEVQELEVLEEVAGHSRVPMAEAGEEAKASAIKGRMVGVGRF